MRHIRIRGGKPPFIEGAPVQRVDAGKLPKTAAFLGADFPGLRPTFHVSQGDAITAGAPVFSDRKHPDIVFAAPFAGVLSAIEYGPRKTLSACILQRDTDAQNVDAVNPIDLTDTALVRNTLLNKGLWPAFRTRPFGQIPTPDAQPSAIFVTATQTSPLAPDPHVVLATQQEQFQHGITVLKQLTEGDIHICQSDDSALCPQDDRINSVVFVGAAAAALAGTHIDYLHPVGPHRHVWTIGYQDVAAIGHLFQTGQYQAERVIAIAGPHAGNPRLIRTCLGANIHDLCKDEVAADHHPSRVCLMSGNPMTGDEAAFLGRFDDQITLTTKTPVQQRPSRLSRLFCTQSALIPTTGLERAIGPRMLPVPLMRALSVGDSEAAERLGCLSLIEEDVARLSARCSSGADYGALLRQVLDELAAEQA